MSTHQPVVVFALCLSSVAAGREWVQNGNGNWYRLTTSAGSWQDAQAEAVAEGGNLVTINDESENQWLYDTFTTDLPAWIGFNELNVTGTWEWASGEGGNWDEDTETGDSYENWDDSEPNNGQAGWDEDCVVMQPFAGGPWADANCCCENDANFVAFFGIIESPTGPVVPTMGGWGVLIMVCLLLGGDCHLRSACGGLQAFLNHHWRRGRDLTR